MLGSSVNSITRGLSKMAAKLESHHKAKCAEVDRHKAGVEEEKHRHATALDGLQVKINEASSERDRALSVAGKIRDLIG